MTLSSTAPKRFAIAVSFPGEHRQFVRNVVKQLSKQLGRDRVFYDEWCEAELVGLDGDLKLKRYYREQCEMVVPFFSEHYAKPWCRIEWHAIRAMLLQRRAEDAVVPVELDGTRIDGWEPVDFAIRRGGRTATQIAEQILAAYRHRYPQNLSASSADTQAALSSPTPTPTAAPDHAASARRETSVRKLWLAVASVILAGLAGVFAWHPWLTPEPPPANGGAAPAPIITLGMLCGAEGYKEEEEACNEGIEAWKATHPGVHVDMRSNERDKKLLNNSIDTRLANYKKWLTTTSYGQTPVQSNLHTNIDIYQIDINWVDDLGSAIYEFKCPDYNDISNQGHLPKMIEAGKIAGKLVAVPWSSNFGVLYYNIDLLKTYIEDEHTPDTWDELYTTSLEAKKKAANNGQEITGFVFQGKDYEGLTCNALEWLYSSTNNNKEASRIYNSIASHIGQADIEPLKAVASWVGTIAPCDVLTYNEDDANNKFRAGEVIFMRNWIYYWKEVNAASRVKGRVGITILPAWGQNGRTATTLGGWLLAIIDHRRLTGRRQSVW